MLIENYDKVKELMTELDRCKKLLSQWESCDKIGATIKEPYHNFDTICINPECPHELNSQAEAFIRSCQIFYEKRIREISKRIEFL